MFLFYFIFIILSSTTKLSYGLFSCAAKLPAAKVLTVKIPRTLKYLCCSAVSQSQKQHVDKVLSMVPST